MLKTNRKEINLIVHEYMKEELTSKGIKWMLDEVKSDSQSINEKELDSNKRRQIIQILSKLTKSICTEFSDNLNSMCINLENHLNENSSNLIELDYPSFKSVADELFSHGFKWSHIVCLFAWCFKLILFKINDNHYREFAKNICDYLTSFLSQNLLEWINQHGSWLGLMDEYYEHFSDSKDTSASKKNSNKFKWSANKIDATIGFLGFALFGIFLLNKH